MSESRRIDTRSMSESNLGIITKKINESISIINTEKVSELSEQTQRMNMS